MPVGWRPLRRSRRSWLLGVEPLWPSLLVRRAACLAARLSLRELRGPTKRPSGPDSGPGLASTELACGGGLGAPPGVHTFGSGKLFQFGGRLQCLDLASALGADTLGAAGSSAAVTSAADCAETSAADCEVEEGR